MSNDLHDLNSLVDKNQTTEDDIPDYGWAMDYFLRQGVSYNQFLELPLPYIFMMLKTNRIRQRKREKELDK